MEAPLALEAVSPRGGRPSRAQAELIADRILDAATALFLSEGYGAVTIEQIAQRARVSKRTLYQRFQGKPPLFGAVLQRLVGRLRPPDIERLFEGPSLRAILTRLAERLLDAALVPEAIALYRLVLAEAARFPEIALMANQMGARQEAVERIAALLLREAKGATARARFAAEQFLQMVIASPQRRALGLGPPMSAADRRAWARETVALFLDGHLGAARASTSRR